MNSMERVRNAIHFGNPDRVPVLQFNRDQEEGDILLCPLWRAVDGGNEWGYRFESRDDGTMGHPAEPVLASWDDFPAYPRPEVAREERIANMRPVLDQARGHYLLGAIGLTGFNLYTFIRGFENAVLDLVLEPEKAAELADLIFGHETRQIEVAAEAGLHGVHFSDDWGSQEGLLIDPALWRSFFKPRYKAQCDRAHELGLEVWFHSCGNIGAIIPEFHEIGVDVINISQPNVVDLEEVGRRFRGRQCFMMPISYQTVSITGTPAEIIGEGRRLHRLLAAENGGFIGYVEEYTCMGMTEANYQACRDAFRLPAVSPA
jgi:uroporphyrinogen decarboxylase